MIYSVYNWDNGKYDYYADKKPMPVADAPGKSRTLYSGKARVTGVAPDDIAVKLPLGAKRVGSGDEAKGAVAVSGFSLGGPSWVKIGLLVGSTFLLMKVMR